MFVPVTNGCLRKRFIAGTMKSLPLLFVGIKAVTSPRPDIATTPHLKTAIIRSNNLKINPQVGKIEGRTINSCHHINQRTFATGIPTHY